MAIILQPYKGKATRFTCPACGKPNSFTRYIKTETNTCIHPKVGVCNRIIKCGYHYTPKAYFAHNPMEFEQKMRSKQYERKFQPLKKISFIPADYVQQYLCFESDFRQFLRLFLSEAQIASIVHKYYLGATKNAEVIFWQIDSLNRVRTGKIMQYNPQSGKRIKHESGAIDWVHNKLKKSNKDYRDFNLAQCFFGEHLLSIHKNALVAIVESEKTAVIASALVPDIIWLATGSVNGLSIDKCKVLVGRNVILYPDLKAFDKWSQKSLEIQAKIKCRIQVSKLLENRADENEKELGLDIADFICEQLKNEK